jgi:hypothetical protein
MHDRLSPTARTEYRAGSIPVRARRRMLGVMKILAISLVLAGGVVLAQREPPPAVGARPLDRTGTRPRAMANCPSLVPGATTVARNRRSGVELTIRAHDRTAAREIRRRARLQAALPPVAGPIQHTGTGTGGGAMGYCPVVHTDARVTVYPVRGGARVLLIARNPADVARLQRTVRDRTAALRPIL